MSIHNPSPPLPLAPAGYPYVLRTRDNSTYASYSQRVSNPTPLRFGDSSTYASIGATLALPRHYVPGIVRLTLQASSRLVEIRFRLGSLSTSVISHGAMRLG
ncbi:MAG: hypothetical protein JW925_01100 [Syntrophaceae bacterium]|nr:hypothetical protein [Syntrophaceae bacterium]